MLELNFRTASYHTIAEVVDGLRTVMGHLIQVGHYVLLLTHTTKLNTQGILQRKGKALDTILNTKLFDYMKVFFSKDPQVFDKVGIQR